MLTEPTTAANPAPASEGKEKLEQAVGILNRERHRGRCNWGVNVSKTGRVRATAAADGSNGKTTLAIDFFEDADQAIAIAEKLDPSFRMDATLPSLEWELYDDGFIIRVPEERFIVRAWCRRKRDEWEGSLALGVYTLYRHRGTDIETVKALTTRRLGLLLAALG
jgi:hypothetical protein